MAEPNKTKSECNKMEEIETNIPAVSATDFNHAMQRKHQIKQSSIILNNISGGSNSECNNTQDRYRPTKSLECKTTNSIQDNTRKRQQTIKSLRSSKELLHVDKKRQILLQKVNQINVSLNTTTEIESNPESESTKIGNVPNETDTPPNTMENISNSRSSSLDSINDCNMPVYQNILEAKQKVLENSRTRYNTMYSDDDNIHLEDHYVTITKYDPIWHNKSRKDEKNKNRNSDEMHYKTILTIFDNEEKYVQKKMSKVRLSKDNVEKEEHKVQIQEYIVDELIDTEEKYIANLQIAVNIYQDTLQHSIGDGPVHQMFNGIENILIGTTAMLYQLIEVRSNYEAIGNVFLKNIDFFDLYPPYCKNLKNAVNLCAKYEHQIKAIEKNIPLDLVTCLHLPFQRLTKYEQLLGKLTDRLQRQNLPVSNLENAERFIHKLLQKGNDLAELDLIQGRSYEFFNTGNFRRRDSFKLLSPERCDVVLFLFDKMIIITKKDRMRQDNYYAWKDISLYDVSVIHEETHRTKFWLSNKIYHIRLDAIKPKIKQEWLDYIDGVLWQQLEEAKRRNLSFYNLKT